MANQTFDGFIRDEAAALLPDAYVQAYFRRVNAGSSAPQWNAARQVGADGYYSFSLGDADCIGVEGVASAGDQVIIAVWYGEATRLGTAKTAFAYRVVTISGDTHTQDVVCWDDVAPETTMSGAATVERLTDYTLTNGASDSHTLGNEIQGPSYSEVAVFDAAGVQYVAMDWGDGSAVENLTGNGTHQYDDAPGTALTLSAAALDNRNNADLTPWTQGLTVLARTPTASIAVTDATPTIGDTITFSVGSLTDPDATVASVDWSWDGGSTWPVTGAAAGAMQDVVCSTTTDFVAALRLHWQDGVQARATVVDTQAVAVSPTALFTSTNASTPSTRYEWTSTGLGTISNYAWDLDISDGAGGWTDEASASGGGSSTFAYSFVTAGTYRLTLTVTDADGEQATTAEDYTVTVDSSGGSNTWSLDTVNTLRICDAPQTLTLAAHIDGVGYTPG